MPDGGSRRRNPSRSLPRDPRDEEIYRKRKRYKEDDERNFLRYKGDDKGDEDGRILDDENLEPIQLWYFQPDDNGRTRQVTYYHDPTELGPLSPDEVKKRRPRTPTDPQIYPAGHGPDQPNATTAKACGTKPSPRGVHAGVSGERDRTKVHGVVDFAARSYTDPPPRMPPPPPLPPIPQGCSYTEHPPPRAAMNKAAPAVAPAAAMTRSLRVCRPTRSAGSYATHPPVEAAPGKDTPTAKDARHVDMPVEAPPGNVHRPNQQKHEADVEDEVPYPPWARNIDYIIDEDDIIVPPADDEVHPDPEDQC